ncbi:hypothetical protein [Nonomuraea salmonea]|uniref:hypothetical protein n=1 Tax=Nonomuraea salmonea TaxID=46181 RepID=UPI002FEACEE5
MAFGFASGEFAECEEEYLAFAAVGAKVVVEDIGDVGEFIESSAQGSGDVGGCLLNGVVHGASMP